MVFDTALVDRVGVSFFLLPKTTGSYHLSATEDSGLQPWQACGVKYHESLYTPASAHRGRFGGYLTEETARTYVTAQYNEQISPLEQATHARVAIIGVGVVGGATALGFSALGHEVRLFDSAVHRAQALDGNGMQVSHTIDEAVTNSDVIMLCLPTPTVEGRCDIGILLSVATAVGGTLAHSNGYRVIVVRSTVPPMAFRHIIIPTLERASGKMAGRDFGVCANPEFLREASPSRDFQAPDRVVVGEIDARAGDLVEDLYRPFRRPIIRCSLEEASLIKYVSNAFLATKISFFNEMHVLCMHLEANPRVVEKGVALDSRIGPYGTRGGQPFGGACLLKDLEALIGSVRDLGIEPKMLAVALELNRSLASGIQGWDGSS